MLKRNAFPEPFRSLRSLRGQGDCRGPARHRADGECRSPKVQHDSRQAPFDSGAGARRPRRQPGSDDQAQRWLCAAAACAPSRYGAAAEPAACHRRPFPRPGRAVGAAEPEWHGANGRAASGRAGGVAKAGAASASGTPSTASPPPLGDASKPRRHHGPGKRSDPTDPSGCPPSNFCGSNSGCGCKWQRVAEDATSCRAAAAAAAGRQRRRGGLAEPRRRSTACSHAPGPVRTPAADGARSCRR